MTPHLHIPKRFHSRRQYVRWSKLCRDWLIKFHGFKVQDFIRIGRSEPTLYADGRYPRSFLRQYFGRKWPDRLPRGAVIHWPEGTNWWGEGYDPNCAVCIASDVQHNANIQNCETRGETQEGE